MTRSPHYQRPPVVEVVCGVQFSGAEGWRTPHFGNFWQQIQDEYQEFEDRPPLERIQLDHSTPAQPRLTTLPPLRRVFYIQPPGNFLIQLQPNRILHNWRKIHDSDEYPRYGIAYSKFLNAWAALKGFASSARLSEPLPEFFELAYINHIFKEGAKFPRDVWEFLAFYDQTPRAVVANDSSALAMHFEWPLPNQWGVLTFDLRHGVRPGDEREVLLIELNTRGKVSRDGPRMDEWFDAAHHAIVDTFDRLTTGFAHELWEKTEP